MSIIELPLVARGIQEWADSPACAGLLLVRQRDALAAIAGRDARIAELERCWGTGAVSVASYADALTSIDELEARIAGLAADLREEQDRRQAMRNEWSAEVAALTDRINALRSDRDCEKRLRKDAEDAREDALARIAELEAKNAR